MKDNIDSACVVGHGAEVLGNANFAGHNQRLCSLLIKALQKHQDDFITTHYICTAIGNLCFDNPDQCKLLDNKKVWTAFASILKLNKRNDLVCSAVCATIVEMMRHCNLSKPIQDSKVLEWLELLYERHKKRYEYLEGAISLLVGKQWLEDFDGGGDGDDVYDEDFSGEDDDS